MKGKSFHGLVSFTKEWAELYTQVKGVEHHEGKLVSSCVARRGRFITFRNEQMTNKRPSQWVQRTY